MHYYIGLKHVSLFEGIEEASLRSIAARVVTRTFPRQSIIVNEGDCTDSLYILLSGTVKIYCSDEDGKEMVLRILRPLEYFGELAVIDGGPRSASVMTLEPARVAVLFREDLLHCLSAEPAIAINLLKAMAYKLRRETESVKSLALMDVYGRVAKLLLELAVQENDGTLVAKRLSYHEIASRIGASREMVGRIFKDLKKGGYVTLQSRTIIINEQLPERW